jgi:hypothetical protein
VPTGRAPEVRRVDAAQKPLAEHEFGRLETDPARD